jgi:preprotein translocase subunit SecA
VKARRPGGQPAGQNVPDAQNDPIPAGFAPRRPQRLQYSAPSVDGGTHVETSQGPGVGDEFARAGRNDPCPCGSGRKFKRCHGDPRSRADGI